MFAAKLEQLFIVSVISNTPRFKRRWELYEQFERRVRQSGIDHITVEVAFGDRHFMTNPSDPRNLQIATVEEFWHKENLIQLGIAHGRRIFQNKTMVGWVDADCAPVGKSFNDWWKETWHMLQHNEFGQMWEYLQPLDYDHNPLGAPNPSFVSNYIKWGTPYPKASKGYPTQWGSPGLAWAANLSALDQIGGIPDCAILGAGDWYLAHMLISDLPFPDMTKYSAGYLNYWKQKQALCEKWIKRDVGYVKGLYTHFFHGKIVNRGYNTRENILIEGQFDPNTDLKRDGNGLWQLETWEPRQIRMRDRIRAYFRARNEDSIDS